MKTILSAFLLFALFIGLSYSSDDAISCQNGPDTNGVMYTPYQFGYHDGAKVSAGYPPFTQSFMCVNGAWVKF